MLGAFAAPFPFAPAFVPASFAGLSIATNSPPKILIFSFGFASTAAVVVVPESPRVAAATAALAELASNTSSDMNPSSLAPSMSAFVLTLTPVQPSSAVIHPSTSSSSSSSSSTCGFFFVRFFVAAAGAMVSVSLARDLRACVACAFVRARDGSRRCTRA